MISNAFDSSKPLIKPEYFYKNKRIKDIKTNTCIVTFSYHVKEEVLRKYHYDVLGQSGTANGKIDIYYLNELNVLFFMSPIGSSISATILEEVSYITGATNYIYFGSCGVLQESAKGKVIIPTESFRDEGLSYHYVEARDYINMSNHETIEKVCIDNDIKYVKGKNWTTDAIYRETIDKTNKRREDGCISVDMEASGLQAVADYLNLNLYVFFFSGDILSSEWKRGDLGGKKEKARQLSSFDLAILIQNEINGKTI